MVLSCAAYGCQNRYNKKPKGVTFHRFPKKEDQRGLWEKAVRRENWMASSAQSLCSVHFEDACFDRTGQTVRLREHSVPSLFPAFPKYYQSVKMNRKAPKDRSSTYTSSPADSHSGQVSLSDLPVEAFSQVDEIIEAPSPADEQDTPRKKSLKRLVETYKVELASKVKKIKLLHQRNRRLKRKCASFKELLSHLDEKRMLSESAVDVLSKSLPPETKELVHRVEKMCNGNLKHVNKYSPELRTFALTLHYVRNSFNKCLPHTRTLRQWYSAVNGEPGFTKEAFNAISLKVQNSISKGNKVHVALVVDEMSIRRHVEYDGKKILGYVDMGTELDADDLPEATHSCVYMVVSLKEHWEVPCGYFLVHSLSGPDRAELTKKCLEKVHETGAIVESITFDGTSCNLSMAESLGASLYDTNNIIPSFCHPSDSTKQVNVFLDPSHMLKLVRNCLADKKVIYDGQNRIISWKYITELQKVQEKEGLRLANKLTKSHVDWHRNKMRVRLAAQTLSSSVADALVYCERTLKLPQFTGAQATADFLRKFDRLFDILNSRSPFSKNYKAPMQESNFMALSNFFTDMSTYIRSLKTEKVNGTLLVQSSRKTAFLGFLVDMSSVKDLYERLVRTSEYKYILTYKMSQDHLEMFFGCVRQHCGWNNNPTVRQFKSSYKKMLVHNQDKCSKNGNCIDLTGVEILITPATSKNLRIGSPNFSDTFLNTSSRRVLEPTLHDHDYDIPDFQILSLYVEHVVPYIAGFVVKSLWKKMDCKDCIASLFANEENDESLIGFKNNGGLTLPSNDVVNICKLTERCFRDSVSANLNSVVKHQFPLVVAMSSNERGFFKCLEYHVKDLDPLNGHVNELVKKISQRYLDIRIHHATKELNRNREGTKV